MSSYSAMTDFEIDAAVAAIIHPGRKITNFAGEAVVWFGNLETLVVRYCNSWADAGPIIQRKEINILFNWNEDGIHGASAGFPHKDHEDKNPLRAAMIVFLMMQGKA
ncbi:phage protein NinX family protein [Pantoea sp. aB]|uniref:phage protein NinX family protein n=1 Tax=Pantoea sp. aB TaxID=517433 RepID=UPI0001E09BBC|nr:phage protein NinX family protein [Pantoea sp. aB]EFM18649.1 Protein of unknown function DUF2591 [Pantoea sp. aB]